MKTTDHGVLLPLPTDPVPAIKVLLRYFTPDKPELCYTLHATYELIGCSLSAWDECPTPVASTGTPTACFEEELKKAHDTLNSSTGSGTPITAIPWSLLLTLALDFLRKLLENR